MAIIKFIKRIKIKHSDALPFDFVDAKLAALNKELGIIG